MKLKSTTQAQARDISPHGWYIASYLLRFVKLGEAGNNDPEKRFLTWENTILVKAENLGKAYDKAVQFALPETQSYKGGPKGLAVQWVFEGVTELVPVHEKFKDGAELMWGQRSPRKLKNIRMYARTKGDFLHE